MKNKFFLFFKINIFIISLQIRSSASCPDNTFTIKSNTGKEQCVPCNECKVCFEQTNSADKIVCRQCIFRVHKLVFNIDGSCGPLEGGQEFNIWNGGVKGCNQAKCICDSTKTKCTQCLDSNQFYYPQYESCYNYCDDTKVKQDNQCLDCENAFENCVECKNSICIKCLKNLTPTIQGCVSCEPQNIVNNFCKHSSCKTLLEKSVVRDINKIICDECVDKKFVKTIKSICLDQCPPGYNLNNGICEKCTVKNCQQCPQTNNCKKCNSGYLFWNQYECITRQECKQRSGYEDEVEQSCIFCDTSKQFNLVNCDQDKCTGCVKCDINNGWYLDDNNNCKKCKLLCKKCNKLTCLECEYPNLYVPSNTNTNKNYDTNCTCRDQYNKECIYCNTLDAQCGICPEQCPKTGKITNNYCQCKDPIDVKCPINFSLEKNPNSITTFACLCMTDLSKCLICSPTNGKVCTKCVTGYYLDARGNCSDQISCSIQNCETCVQNDINKCQICKSTYETSIDQSKCVKCTIQNCAQCYDNDLSKCKQCKDQYDLSSDQSNCFIKPCQVQNCTICDADDIYKCQNCNKNYGISPDKQKCDKLCQVSYCQQCNIDDVYKCDKCNQQYEINSDKSQCNKMKCQVQNCQICEEKNVFKCNQCIEQYEINSDQSFCNKMQCKVSNCQLCKEDDVYKCKQCFSQYVINYDESQCNKMKCQVSNCQKCEENDVYKCNQCVDQYNINSDKSYCLNMKCQVSNCQLCEENNISKCKQCDQQYLINPDKSQCNKMKCQVSNCQICEENDVYKCNTCISQFKTYENKSQCIKMDCQVVNCQQCDANDVYKCNICISQYKVIQDNSQCQKMPCQVSNCQTCETSSIYKCKTCVFKYQINNDQSQCVMNCQVNNCQICHQNEIYQCQKCYEQYELNFDESQCNKMSCQVSNCIRCNSNDIYKCELCVDQYELNGDQTACNKMDCQVNNCQMCDQKNVQKCQTCDLDYQISSDRTKCEKIKCKVQNCKLCEYFSIYKCNTCIDKYETNQDQTQCIIPQCKVANCEFCEPNNTKQCKNCKDQYEVNDDRSQCLQKPCEVQNCQECDANNIKKCIKCIYQNELNWDNSKCTKMECIINNCKVCFVNNVKKCQQCVDQYQTNSDKSQCEKMKCQVNNCELCEVNDVYNCQQCANDFKQNSAKTICQKFIPCDIQNCQQCDENEIDKCKQCKDGYKLENSRSACIYQNQIFKVTSKPTNEGFQVELQFEQNIKFDIDDKIEDLIEFEIPNFNQFTVKFEKYDITNPRTIHANIIMNENCNESKLFAIIKNQKFLENNRIQKSQAEEKLPEFEHKTTKKTQEMKQSQSISEASQSISASIQIIGIILGMFGNFFVMFSIIDAASFIYLYILIDVKYPYNILKFCEFFKCLFFKYLPGLFNSAISQIDLDQQTKEFGQKGISLYFLNNAGQWLTMTTIVVGFYLLLKLLSYVPIQQMQRFIVTRFLQKFEYNGFINLFWLIYIYAAISCFLQFHIFKANNFLSVFNYFLSTATFVAIVVVPVFFIVLIKKHKQILKNQLFYQKYHSLVGWLKLISPRDNSTQPTQIMNDAGSVHEQGLNSYGQVNQISSISLQEIDQGLQQKEIQNKQISKYDVFSKYYFVILFGRKFFFAAFISLLTDSAYAQMVLISLLNILIGAFLVIVKPFENKYRNYKNILYEILFFGLNMIVMFLKSDDYLQNDEERKSAGWAFIVFSSIILFICIAEIVVELSQHIVNLQKDQIQTSKLTSKVSIKTIPVYNSASEISDTKSPKKKKFREGFIVSSLTTSTNQINSQSYNSTSSAISPLGTNTFSQEIKTDENKNQDNLLTTENDQNDNISNRNLRPKRIRRTHLFQNNPTLQKTQTLPLNNEDVIDQQIHTQHSQSNQLITSHSFGDVTPTVLQKK